MLKVEEEDGEVTRREGTEEILNTEGEVIVRRGRLSVVELEELEVLSGNLNQTLSLHELNKRIIGRLRSRSKRYQGNTTTRGSSRVAACSGEILEEITGGLRVQD